MGFTLSVDYDYDYDDEHEHERSRLGHRRVCENRMDLFFALWTRSGPSI
jgi:hypothetical protein